VALLRVDEIREVIRIADKEDRRVVAGEIPVAVLGVEFHRKAAQVALRVGCAEFAGNVREARDYLGLLADLGKDRGLRVFGDVVGDP
jgi:hypothetical protein